MICRHCGARIERATMYNTNPPDGQAVYFADFPSDCAHEPQEPRDPQGWRASLATVAAIHWNGQVGADSTSYFRHEYVQRPAAVTYPAGSCGEYLQDAVAEDAEDAEDAEGTSDA